MPVCEFVEKLQNRTGLSSRCRACMRETAGKYEARPENRERLRPVKKAIMKRYLESEQGKAKCPARRAYAAALSSGKLVRGPCAHGPEGCRGGIHGHHWSYKIENALDVIWLCVWHHSQEHLRLRRLGVEIEY